VSRASLTDPTALIAPYCERTGPGLWAEPLNAVTNLAFLVAAVLALRHYLRQPHLRPGRSWDLLLLLASLFAIAIGSGLWHTVATRWAALADVLPIGVFINVFLASFLIRIAGVGIPATVAALVAYQLLFVAVGRWVPHEFLSGSLFYAPAWLGLLGMTLYLRSIGSRLSRRFGLALVVLSASLTFRSIDQPLCALVPVGTHFLWHLLNAVVLYLLMVALTGAVAGRRRMQSA
jgi:hypothetical protein